MDPKREQTNVNAKQQGWGFSCYLYVLSIIVAIVAGLMFWPASSSVNLLSRDHVKDPLDDPDKIGEIIFTYARDGNCTELDTLLQGLKTTNKQQTLINWKNPSDRHRTPLHRASGNGHLACVKTLLQQPLIDINALNEDEFTPLLVASYRGHPDIVATLLHDPRILPSVNRGDLHGYTPLLCACLGGHLEVIRLLSQHQALDINGSSNNGETCALWASRSGHVQVIKFLTDLSNVDWMKADSEGQSPLSVARSEEIKQLLLSKINASPSDSV